MNLNHHQVNAALHAIILTRWPDFRELSEMQKSSIGQATWYWFAPLIERLPEEITSPDDVMVDLHPFVVQLASDYLVRASKHADPDLRRLPDQEVVFRIGEEPIDALAMQFIDLAKLGISAIIETRKLEEVIADAPIVIWTQSWLNF